MSASWCFCPKHGTKLKPTGPRVPRRTERVYRCEECVSECRLAVLAAKAKRVGPGIKKSLANNAIWHGLRA